MAFDRPCYSPADSSRCKIFHPSSRVKKTCVFLHLYTVKFVLHSTRGRVEITVGLVHIPISPCIDKLSVIIAPDLIKIPIWCYGCLHVYHICFVLTSKLSMQCTAMQPSILHLSYNKAKLFQKSVTTALLIYHSV